jgi:hypothetical protein
MKSIWFTLLGMSGIIFGNSTSFGQIATLGQDNDPSSVAAASYGCGCDGGSMLGCDPGCGCASGTVWGTTCMDSCPAPCGMRHPLFSPCPNPCPGTFLGGVLMDLKCAVGTGITNVMTCLFPCSPCAQCGAIYEDDCGCAVDMGNNGYYCDDGGVPGHLMSVPAAETIPSQPLPQPAVKPSDPFRDDPATNPQAVRFRGTRRTTAAAPRRVARTAFYQPMTGKSSKANSASGTAKISTNGRNGRVSALPVSRHYHHRPPMTMRSADYATPQPNSNRRPSVSDGGRDEI